jgi:calcium binding protein 39
VTKYLQQIKGVLLGDGGTSTYRLNPIPQLTTSPPKSTPIQPNPAHPPHTDPLPELVAQLAQEAYSTDLLLYLVSNLSRFEFEARKDVVQIFNHLLRRQIGSRWPTVEYLNQNPQILFATLEGYETEEVALNTGMILRDMLKHEALCKTLLYSEE